MRMLVPCLVALAAVSLAAWSGSGAGAERSDDRTPQEALTPFQIARTERLLETRVACLGCHRIAGRGGQIGPSLDGLGARAEADYVRRVIVDPAGTIAATLMPAQTMSEHDVERLVTYLLTRPAAAAAAPLVLPEAPPVLADSERVDGAALYARHCAACHGGGGGGDGWNAPNLPVPPTAHADAALMSARPDDSLFDAIHAGAFVLDGSPRMPAFGALLAPEQIRALVAHIRTLCACAQPAWAGG